MNAILKRLILRTPIGRYLRGSKRYDPIAWSRKYDRETVEVMRRHLRPDSSCVDVGAHRGELLRAMVDLAPAGRHHAFEPLPHLAAGLGREFPQVSVHECALAESAGESTFEHVVNSPGYSGLRRRIYDRPNRVIEQIRVRVETLDRALPRDQPIAFLKIDVEGGELGVMRGGYETIRRFRPIIVFEAGENSTGQYGVTPEGLFRFVTDELGMKVSTMRRWLDGGQPYGESEFAKNWRNGPEFYFIAYDIPSGGRRGPDDPPERVD